MQGLHAFVISKEAIEEAAKFLAVMVEFLKVLAGVVAPLVHAFSVVAERKLDHTDLVHTVGLAAAGVLHILVINKGA